MAKNTAPRRELLSITAAAGEAAVNPATVRRMIAAGELPAYRVGRRGDLRIDRRDVDEVLIRRVKPGEVAYG